MKKVLYVFIALFSLLVLITGTVFAAPARDGYLTLREVRNDSGGGVIFVFDVTGEIAKKELKKGVVFFGDEKYDLHCKLEDNVLTCTTSRKTAGQYVNVNIGGFIFYARVPKTPGSQPNTTQYCYPVLDYVEGEPESQWEQIDTHCQDAPAEYGDSIILFVESIFEFMDGSPFCTTPQSGDAYYRDILCND